jgi:phosphoribosylglycinamide formyltransferase
MDRKKTFVLVRVNSESASVRNVGHQCEGLYSNRNCQYLSTTMSTTTAAASGTPSQGPKRITVLISGSGSNLQALLDASGTSRLPNAQITFVLSSRSNAYGITRAKTHNPPIPTSVCAMKTFLNRNPGATRQDYDAEIARQVLDSRPDLVVLAGWMHILSDAFLEILNGTKPPPSAPALPPPPPSVLDQETNSSTSEQASAPELPFTQTFPIPCINLHPALPGAFDGANAIGRAFDAFQAGEVDKTGVMVHRVVVEVDRGEPLVVREVEIRKEDDLAALEARIHEVGSTTGRTR